MISSITYLCLTCRTDLRRIAFTSYGAFWMSYATILIPGSGIIAAYENTEGGAEQLSAALGIFLITWMIVTFLFLWVTELIRFCLLLTDGYLVLSPSARTSPSLRYSVSLLSLLLFWLLVNGPGLLRMYL